jgi:chorismate mutase
VIRAVRGAIQVGVDTREAVWDAASRVAAGLLSANAIREKDIVSLVFSVTADLRSANPAAGVRRTGFAGTPLFCVQEAEVEGGMPRVIRVLLTWNARGRSPAVPVYLGGAEALRPDLSPPHP